MLSKLLLHLELLQLASPRLVVVHQLLVVDRKLLNSIQLLESLHLNFRLIVEVKLGVLKLLLICLFAVGSDELPVLPLGHLVVEVVDRHQNLAVLAGDLHLLRRVFLV